MDKVQINPRIEMMKGRLYLYEAFRFSDCKIKYNLTIF